MGALSKLIGIRRTGNFLARVVDLPDGGAEIEVMLEGDTWEPSGNIIGWDEIPFKPPASEEMLARFGIDSEGNPVSS